MIPDNIQNLINTLELKKVNLQGDEIWCLCPFHKDRNPTNFSININTGKFFCFSCEAGGNIIYLATTKGLDYYQSQALWRSVANTDIEEIKFPPEKVDDFLVKQYVKNGMSQTALNRCKWDYETLYEYHVHSDLNDNPVLFIKNSRRETCAILVKDGKKDFPIIGNFWKEYGYLGGSDLDNTEKTIVVEGLWDARRVRQVTGYKVLFTGGTKITNAQYKSLARYNNLYIMMDGDLAGRTARDLLHKEAGKVEWFFRTYYCGGYLGDPDEMTDEQINETIKNARTWEEHYEAMKKNGL